VSAGTSRIRPLVEDDLPAIAALRLATFRFSRRRDPAELVRYLRSVFFENPWRDESLPSLVYESGGRVGGFVGIIPRPMVFQGKPLRVVVSTQFMVDPSLRGAAGIELVRRLFAGPQELTLADAAPDAARRIWTGLGGEVAAPYSLFWTRVLRPGRFAMVELGDRLAARALRWGLRPVMNVGDAVLTRLRRDSDPGRGGPRGGSVESLDPAVLESEAPAVFGRSALHPAYRAGPYGWLLERTREGQRSGPLRAWLVRDDQGRAAGWFVYYEERGGILRVMQLAAGPAPDHASLVMRHLLAHARSIGALAARGQLVPPLLPQLAAAGCTFRRRGPWVLVHSRRAEVRHAIARGDAWISALDGERWLSF
jgi:hypothetical protein